jgi:hypothetical protein
MSDISDMLQKLADKRKTRPLSVNAEDLFYKGHITAEELLMIQKGEDVAMSFSKEPELDIKQPNSLDSLSYYGRAVEKVSGIVLTQATKWIPKQLNNNLIRYEVLPAEHLSKPLHIQFEVRFTILNFEKETQQTVGTAIPIDLGMLTQDEEQDQRSWEYFEYQIADHFQKIIMQMVLGLNANDVLIS